MVVMTHLILGKQIGPRLHNIPTPYRIKSEGAVLAFIA